MASILPGGIHSLLQREKHRSAKEEWGLAHRFGGMHLSTAAVV